MSRSVVLAPEPGRQVSRCTERVFRAAVKAMNGNPISPSIREIASHAGVTSSTVQYHVNHLVDLGVLTRAGANKQARARTLWLARGVTILDGRIYREVTPCAECGGATEG